MDMLEKKFQYTVNNAIFSNNPCYIERACDTQLFNLLKAQKYCHVLEPKFMGKTSLLIRVADKLREEKIEVVNISCVNIDSRFYGNELIYELFRASSLADIFNESDLENFIQGLDSVIDKYKISEFMEEIFIPNVTNPTVVILDDMDDLEFNVREDISTLVRSFSEKAKSPSSEAYKKITFCLAGRFSFSGFHTPYNIGEQVFISNFTVDDIKNHPLNRFDKSTINEVFQWTNGHPYLTMLSLSILDENPVTPNELFKTVIREGLFGHLPFSSYFHSCYDNISTHENKADLIQLYLKIKSGQYEYSKYFKDLFLCGVVSRNKIIPKIIDQTLTSHLMNI